MRVLVVNAGSSSLKLRLLGPADELLAAADVDDETQLAAALEGPLREADVVGHRIVHGGERFHDAVEVDAAVETELRRLTELAPLHQPKSLEALDAVRALLPHVPAVACFDTAFHATLSPAAVTYALPAAWSTATPLRRYGFHGLSHAWIARRVPELLRRRGDALRIVSCHLGAGASVCAIAGGVSVDTTMGFTPLEGLVMATRSGSVDPGLLVWLLERGEVSIAQLADGLEHQSGLLALAGTADMRTVVVSAEAGDARAVLALDVYVRSLRAAIAAMAAALGGVDALVFTAGVGEASPAVRGRAVEALGFLGLELDPAANIAADGDCDISPPGSAARVVVVAAREDLEIARQVRRCASRVAG